MQPINILLVEDDPLDIVDIKRSLNKLNIVYLLATANNGEEAIEILAGKTAFGPGILPDILLVDINMPRMNGLEFLEFIRVNDEWKDLKRFILTTSDAEADRASAADLKLSGYIVKPLKLNSPANLDTFNLMIDLLNYKSLGL